MGLTKEEAKQCLIEDGFDVEALIERELYDQHPEGVYNPVVKERCVILKNPDQTKPTVFRFRFYGIKWEGIVADMNHFHHVFKRTNQPDNQTNKDVH